MKGPGTGGFTDTMGGILFSKRDFMVILLIMTITDLDEYFHSLLKMDEFQKIDPSSNGIQVQNSGLPLTRIAFAVDACMETFRRAKEGGAQAIVVHHGLHWGAPQLMTGSYYHRVKYLIENDIALYAIHLPLDEHPVLGTNIALAECLELTDIEPFGVFKGAKVGYKGRLKNPLCLDDVLQKVGLTRETCHALLPFGPEMIERVGIISGGATYDVLQAIDDNLDLYLTGESKHSVYHNCLEAGIHMVSGGHYGTEVMGVRRLLDKFGSDHKIETFFIDVPTGL